MSNFQVNESIQEINKKIKSGKAVVVTAEEMIDIVKKKGEVKAAQQVDVVTTGTFAPMCSSGAFINFGPVSPPLTHLPHHTALFFTFSSHMGQRRTR